MCKNSCGNGERVLGLVKVMSTLSFSIDADLMVVSIGSFCI